MSDAWDQLEDIKANGYEADVKECERCGENYKDNRSWLSRAIKLEVCDDCLDSE